jgi:hypothetical protein
MARCFTAGKRAALVAAAVAAVCALNFFVLRPLYEQGSLDRPAVLINVTVTMVALPGLVVGRAFINGHSLSEDVLRRYYLVVTLTTAATFWALAWVFFRARRRRRERPPSARGREGRSPAARRSGATESAARRVFLRRAVTWSVASGLGALGGYGLWVEPRWLRVRRLRLPLRGLPPALVGLKVAHLTDWSTTPVYTGTAGLPLRPALLGDGAAVWMAWTQASAPGQTGPTVKVVRHVLVGSTTSLEAAVPHSRNPFFARRGDTIALVYSRLDNTGTPEDIELAQVAYAGGTKPLLTIGAGLSLSGAVTAGPDRSVVAGGKDGFGVAWQEKVNGVDEVRFRWVGCLPSGGS